jgi:hypothetical protein
MLKSYRFDQSDTTLADQKNRGFEDGYFVDQLRREARSYGLELYSPPILSSYQHQALGTNLGQKFPQ